MDAERVMLLCVACGTVDLPPHLEALSRDPAFWERLEATTDEDLSPEQLELLGALGVAP